MPAQRSKTVKGQKVTLGIGPEPVRVGGAGSGALSGTLRLANIWVSGTMFYLSLADGEDLSRKADGFARAATGDATTCSRPPEACHLFNETGETIINATLNH